MMFYSEYYLFAKIGVTITVTLYIDIKLIVNWPYFLYASSILAFLFWKYDTCYS